MAERINANQEQYHDDEEDKEILRKLAENRDNIEKFDEYYGCLIKKHTNEVVRAIASYGSEKAEDVFYRAAYQTRQRLLILPEERILNFHIKSYLIEVAKRIFWHEWKRDQRAKNISSLSIQEIDEDIFEFIQDDLSTQPEEQYLQKEKTEAIGEALEAALNRLPSSYRSTFYLRFFEINAEESIIADIAKVLGESTGTIKSRISRGLRKFCALLLEELEKRVGSEEEIVKWLKEVSKKLQQPKQKKSKSSPDTNQGQDEQSDSIDEDQEEEA